MERRMMDTAADREMERLVERRSYNAEHADDPEIREEGWVRSVRRYNSRQREESLRQRLAFHEAMIASHERTFAELAERHRVGKARCEELLGRGAAAEAGPAKLGRVEHD